MPLLVTGVGLLLAPSTGSFFAYAHLISAAWWTGLLVWHLRRYVGASLRAAIGISAAAPDGGASGSEDRANLPLERRDVRGEDISGALRLPG